MGESYPVIIPGFSSVGGASMMEIYETEVRAIQEKALTPSPVEGLPPLDLDAVHPDTGGSEAVTSMAPPDFDPRIIVTEEDFVESSAMSEIVTAYYSVDPAQWLKDLARNIGVSSTDVNEGIKLIVELGGLGPDIMERINKAFPFLNVIGPIKSIAIDAINDLKATILMTAYSLITGEDAPIFLALTEAEFESKFNTWLAGAFAKFEYSQSMVDRETTKLVLNTGNFVRDPSSYKYAMATLRNHQVAVPVVLGAMSFIPPIAVLYTGIMNWVSRVWQTHEIVDAVEDITTSGPSVEEPAVEEGEVKGGGTITPEVVVPEVDTSEQDALKEQLETMNSRFRDLQDKYQTLLVDKDLSSVAWQQQFDDLTSEINVLHATLLASQLQGAETSSMLASLGQMLLQPSASPTPKGGGSTGAIRLRQRAKPLSPRSVRRRKKKKWWESETSEGKENGYTTIF